MDLFSLDNNGAAFSDCRKYRYALWRIWDESKPLVMVIGLNPSTANETDSDPTIESVKRISKYNGYGGFYMMNCLPYISTNPDDLQDCSNIPKNYVWLKRVSEICSEVVFAWGNFDIVKKKKIDIELTAIFPNAKALKINKNGSPKHPLYCKEETRLINYQL